MVTMSEKWVERRTRVDAQLVATYTMSWQSNAWSRKKSRDILSSHFIRIWSLSDLAYLIQRRGSVKAPGRFLKNR